MPTVAYLANQLPSPVEWYVVDEIRELRRRGVQVIPCSSQRVAPSAGFADLQRECLYIWPLRCRVVVLALWTVFVRLPVLVDFLKHAFSEPGVALAKRFKTVFHTLLGIYYAELLREREVDHIHVHHGYFSSWIAMVAARTLHIPFSMTLHGSDVLLHSAFLGVKLRECAFCFTVSDFNRNYILRKWPQAAAGKVRMQRLGAEVPPVLSATSKVGRSSADTIPLLLAVGRLHPVKNHAFLLQACSLLRKTGPRLRCLVVGEGPERQRLARFARQLGLEDVVWFVGHVAHETIGAYYELADLVVLTSQSEGIPLVLMEAMAREKLVLAPAITGIPELVADGETGFLFPAGNLEEFVRQVQQIVAARDRLGAVRQAARRQVLEKFERTTNLEKFADTFLREMVPGRRSCDDEDFVLQQI
jgi:colanic acid/amylovoran biosynthesis glycosyltransferase